MGTTQSKRLRLRIFPQDERALEEIPGKTTHTSTSNVIRVALIFFEQVWSSRLGGFQVVYRKEGSRECPEVLAPGLMRAETAADSGGKKPKTGKSIEIRLTNSDNERIANLLACEAADTFSEAVRRAIRLYAAAVTRCQEGWLVEALSPSGDVLPLTVPGLGGAAQHGKSATSSQWGAAGPRRAVEPANLLDLLPKSLADIVTKLAETENCAAEVLIVDLIRTEALARLEGRRPDKTAEDDLEGGSRIEEPVTPIERLFARTEKINESLATLPEKSPVPSKRKQKAAQSQQEEEEVQEPPEQDTGPHQTDLFMDAADDIDA